jgi:DNA modification methylase
MEIFFSNKAGLPKTLETKKNNSFDFIVLITGALKSTDSKSLLVYLEECIRILKAGGILFVQGTPEILPELGVYLDKFLTFKYWIAVESLPRNTQHRSGLPSVHAAVLLFSKGSGRFNIKQTRLPHQYCSACQRTLKDWGGKAHLMHPGGYVVSDVIKDLPLADNYEHLSKPLLNLLLDMLDFPVSKSKQSELLVDTGQSNITGLIIPKEGLSSTETLVERPLQYLLPGFPESKPEKSLTLAVTSQVGDNLFNVIHQGDAVKILKQYPDESVDLVFADPPYNLDKNYNVYADEQAEEQYIQWCNSWLTEYIRILKPTGSLYLLNLPRWAMYHAFFLNQHLYFQNWIVWDALSEPRGKVMPAHYGLLFYTKHPSNFTFNYEKVGQLDARNYCLRANCIRKRKSIGNDDKEALTDIWWDVHRIKHPRDRDRHPCQLPDLLMQRIIKLSTNPGDVVLDALGGAGTTPIAALQLGRRYVAIDLDPYYVQIMQAKIAQIEQAGYVPRESTKKQLQPATKKELQLELRHLALELGRLPTPEDVKERSQYQLDLFFNMFPTWGKALKAAKLEIQS